MKLGYSTRPEAYNFLSGANVFISRDLPPSLQQGVDFSKIKVFFHSVQSTMSRLHVCYIGDICPVVASVSILVS